MAWRGRQGRKPLILRGARQVGKSALITEFGRREFDNTVVLNFEKDRRFRQLFEEVDDVKDILAQVEIIANCRIIPGKTLLFLDEIQDCPASIGRLRYFYEEVPELHVVSAGSLLEFALDEGIRSFPVGRVEFLYLFPLVFEEYLGASDHPNLTDYLQTVTIQKGIQAPLATLLRDELRRYVLVGGMPEIVTRYLEHSSLQEAQLAMEGLLATLQADFRKYRTRFDPHHIELVFSELVKWMGQKLNLSKIAATVSLSSLQISTAVALLAKAMLMYRNSAVSALQFPLQAKSKVQPKFVFLDVGLGQHLNHIHSEILSSANLSVIYRGALMEQFVAQELLVLSGTRLGPALFHWESEKKTAQAEVDFIFPYQNALIPIEVKAGKGTTLGSLHQFALIHRPPVSVRIYDGPLALEKISVKLPTGQVLSYPLLSLPPFLIRQLPRFIAAVS